MLKIGLCSITFRKLEATEIITLATKSGIHGIEWGGDVHVPPGDFENARAVRKETESAGLEVSSYGSYYRCTEDTETFSEILETAKILGAPVIRIWAGNKGSDESSHEDRRLVVERIRTAVTEATKEGILIALEYHRNTLTDTCESAHKLLDEVGLPELKLFWQPRTGGIFSEDIKELEASLPHLSHVHCFHWVTGDDGVVDRRPLAEGTEEWSHFLKIVSQLQGDRFVILEFVRDASPAQFKEDVKCLQKLIGNQ